MLVCSVKLMVAGTAAGQTREKEQGRSGPARCPQRAKLQHTTADHQQQATRKALAEPSTVGGQRSYFPCWTLSGKATCSGAREVDASNYGTELNLVGQTAVRDQHHPAAFSSAAAVLGSKLRFWCQAHNRRFPHCRWR